jgi:two-component system, LytTR family, response regulator
MNERNMNEPGTNETTLLTAMIVDDEAPARALIREYLSRHSDIRIVAECLNGFEAVKAASELKPDLLFLDIQMPKLDGFEVLDLIGPDAANVIFTTAFDEYALRAFNVHALDYLLKPFGEERFAEALTQARGRIKRGEPIPGRALLETRRGGAAVDRLLVRDRSNVHVIPVEQIDYIEAQDDYVSIRTAGRSYLKEQTLGELEEQLESKGFLRIHRRYILNVSRLAKIELSEKDNRIAILNDKTELPISRSGYVKLRSLL